MTKMMKNKKKYLIIKAGMAAAAVGVCIAGCIFVHAYSNGLSSREKITKNIQELSAEENTLQEKIQGLNGKIEKLSEEKSLQEQEKEQADMEKEEKEPENYGEGQEAFPDLNGALTVYESYDNLCQKNGQEYIDQLLASMITVSDNEAANCLVRLLGQGDEEAGKQAVNVFCITNNYTSSNMGRMLLETGTDRENYTSPQDCVKFLWDIYQGVFPHFQDMLELLKAQERTGKIPAGIPDSVETANKTGELENVENDAAIVWAGEHPYIVCIMSSELQNTSEARDRIVSMSEQIYEKSQG
mgnify:CR=1 FL=1